MSRPKWKLIVVALSSALGVAAAAQTTLDLDWSASPRSLSAALTEALVQYAKRHPGQSRVEATPSRNPTEVTLVEGANEIRCEKRLATPRADYHCTLRIEPAELEWTAYDDSFQSVLSDALVQAKWPGIRRKPYLSRKGAFDTVGVRAPTPDRKAYDRITCAAAMERDQLHCWFELRGHLLPEEGMDLDGYPSL
jgi:hypothetical protein